MLAFAALRCRSQTAISDLSCCWVAMRLSWHSAPGNRLPEGELCPASETYCGFNPRVSNCRLHSAGASRSRSTPIPRSNRPSTAALTRSGARNASEMTGRQRGNGSLLRPESSVPSPGLQLLRFQPEGFELLAPFCRGITKSLDSDTTRQPTFDRSPDEIRCEERERDRHVDLTHAALLT